MRRHGQAEGRGYVDMGIVDAANRVGNPVRCFGVNEGIFDAGVVAVKIGSGYVIGRPGRNRRLGDLRSGGSCFHGGRYFCRLLCLLPDIAGALPRKRRF